MECFDEEIYIKLVEVAEPVLLPPAKSIQDLNDGFKKKQILKFQVA